MDTRKRLVVVKDSGWGMRGMGEFFFFWFK